MEFHEVQPSYQNNIARFVTLVVGIAYLVNLYVFVRQIIFNDVVGTSPASDSELIISTVISTIIVGGVIYLLLISKLVTIVDGKGISYQYWPFHRRMRTISWKDIKSAHIRKYNPILEYGGWGVRLGLFGKGKAYNVSGSRGLQIALNNGKRLLIGTQRPQELETIIDQHMPLSTD